MTYFSRLTDIVTCSLTEMLREAEDPLRTIDEIVVEMEEGLAGARRSVATAGKNADRLHVEIERLGAQVATWHEAARSALSEGQEETARQALARKQEVEDIAAGLNQEYAAALATRDHLETTLRALQGRLADARRKREDLIGGGDLSEEPPPAQQAEPTDSRAQRIEEELAELKRQMGTRDA